MRKNNIDIVVTWVDGDDPEWQKEKAKYEVSENADASIYRYRDFGLLRYWFRGIEQFAPWVRKVHFVTWGHVPEWLNTSHPKLNIVKHEDFIPKKYLPTFSSHTIENNIHRIVGLSERFVLMNDDVYFINNTHEKDFFRGACPMDTVGLNVHCPVKGITGQYSGFNDAAIINSHFDMRRCIRRDFLKWINIKNGDALFRTLILLRCPRFPGFYQAHLPSSFLKSTFVDLWSKEYDTLDATCNNKFRSTTDVNQWLFKEWQIAEGNFEIRSSKFGKSFYIDRDGVASVKKQMIPYIIKQKGKMISVNDGPMTDKEFSDIRAALTDAFDAILSDRCEYEK